MSAAWADAKQFSSSPGSSKLKSRYVRAWQEGDQDSLVQLRYQWSELQELLLAPGRTARGDG